ncbi:MAG: hypothetical protein CL582_18630 [Alteromonadaceae bacterium]|nr:hypothetical protein [Alteromonadaceae bacterium]
MIEANILQDAISMEQIHHDIDKNLISLEYLENTLQYTALLESRVDSGELTMESAVEHLRLVTQDLSLEASIFQKGSPVHRIIAAVMRAIETIIDKTKELVSKLFSSRKRLHDKAVDIKKAIRNKEQSSDWNTGRVSIGTHSVLLMDGKRPMGVLDISSGIFQQNNSANTLAGATNGYIDALEDISERAEKDVHWVGDSDKLDELFEAYLDRIGYEERSDMIAGLPIDEPILGSRLIVTDKEYDDVGRFLSSIRMENIAGVKTQELEALNYRQAIALCDTVIESLREDRRYTDTRSEMNKSVKRYKESIDRLYKLFYQSGMSKEIGDTMIKRVKSITKRDICRDVVKLVIDLDKNAYRACLSSLIWVDKSLKK